MAEAMARRSGLKRCVLAVVLGVGYEAGTGFKFELNMIRCECMGDEEVGLNSWDMKSEASNSVSLTSSSSRHGRVAP